MSKKPTTKPTTIFSVKDQVKINIQEIFLLIARTKKLSKQWKGETRFCPLRQFNGFDRTHYKLANLLNGLGQSSFFVCPFCKQEYVE